MGEVTKIEWTGTYLPEPVMWKGESTTFIPGATFNLVIGCQKVSPACKYCYAEQNDIRWSKGAHWGPNTPRKEMSESYWKQPIRWNKEAGAAGIKRKVFCSSQADWAEDHPQLVLARQRLFKLIEETPHLIWLLLTKRPENILRFIPEEWRRKPPANVWYGTTVESQEYVWRVEELCKVPAKLRFVSCEPLLGSLNIQKYLGSIFMETPIFSDRMAINGRGRIHWVIAGGESGKDKDIRPSHPCWFIDLRLQCTNAVVPFLFKQWGEWQDGSNVVDRKYKGRHRVMLKNGDFAEWELGTDHPFRTEIEMQKKYSPEDYSYKLKPRTISRVGKKNAGRHLEEKLYNEMPDTFYKEKLNEALNPKK